MTNPIGSRFGPGKVVVPVRSLVADARCVVTHPTALARTIDLVNVKHSAKYTVDVLDPAVNATIRARPRWAFGLVPEGFSGSSTRWRRGEKNGAPAA